MGKRDYARKISSISCHFVLRESCSPKVKMFGPSQKFFGLVTPLDQGRRAIAPAGVGLTSGLGYRKV